MKLFRFCLRTPRGALFDEDVLSLTLPLEDGEIGILAGREHTILDVAQGILRVRKESGEILRYECAEGLAEVTERAVFLLCGDAYPAESAAEGRKARESELLEEKLRQEKSVVDYKITRVALMRAFEKLKGNHKR